MAQDTAPLLRKGSQGPEVARLQEQLRSLGAFDGAVDGSFGPATETAVKVVQEQVGTAPDGIVGPQTWRAMQNHESLTDQSSESETLSDESGGESGNILARYHFGPSVLRILRAASIVANMRGNQIDSVTIYVAGLWAAEFETSPDPALTFLSAEAGADEKGLDPQDEQMLNYLREHGPTDVPKPFDSAEKLPPLSPNAAAIFGRSQDLATFISGPEIGTRHLVGGLLDSTPVGGLPGARRRMLRPGQTIETLKRRFLEVVAHGWPDEAEIWPGEFSHPEPSQSRPELEPGDGEDSLLDRLLRRRLVVSTMASDDVESARSLQGVPPQWGFGPQIARGDIILIYFPKTLAKNKALREAGPQPSGLRFLLRAAADSQAVDDPNSVFRQIVDIDHRLELQDPIALKELEHPALIGWALARANFRRAGRERDPLEPEVARPLWQIILARNPDIQTELENWLADEPETAAPLPGQRSMEMQNLLARDTWTTNDELGYELYAQAITDSIFSGSSVPPLTVGIQAPWGQGKTSLMRMIQKRFDEEAPARDLRKLETDGETAVAATFGHLRNWAKEAAIWKRKVHSETSLPGAEVPEAAGPVAEGAAGAPVGRESGAGEAWQSEDIDKMPPEKEAERTYRRPGLLITEKRRIPTVWFNPLYYGTTEQIWAGLAHAMLQQLSAQIEDPIRREQFWFRLQLRRINVDAVLNDLRKAVWLRFLPRAVCYAGAAVLAAIVGLRLEPWVLFGVGGAAAVGAAHAVSFIKKADGSLSLERQFEHYVSEPDYRSELGMLHWVDHDLDRALDLLCGDYPVAVFIDDLDRCDPKIVAEIIFAINQFLSLPRRNVFFFLGMDTEMVAAALEDARGLGDAPSATAGESHQSFGWRFMEKFVQLPFVIPHLDDRTARDFAAGRLGGRWAEEAPPEPADQKPEAAPRRGENGDVRPPAPEQTEKADEVLAKADQVDDFEDLVRLAEGEKQTPRSQEDRARVQEAISRKATELMKDPESEEVKRIVEIAMEELDFNPRTITRYFGTLRVLRNLQVATGAISEPHRDRLLVLRATHLLLNWPEAMQWLEPKKKMLNKSDEWVPVIEGLETLVAASSEWGQWAKIWQDKPAPLPPAFKDHRLYEFLKKINADPPGLSDMYAARLF